MCECHREKKVTVLSIQCELLFLQSNKNSLECSTWAAFCILQSEFRTLSKEIPSLSKFVRKKINIGVTLLAGTTLLIRFFFYEKGSNLIG